MRIIKPVVVTVIILLTGCEKDNSERLFSSNEGFCIKIADSLVYKQSQIDFYDFSSHLIYLNNGNSFTFSNRGSFTVFADGIEIYSGQLFPLYSSFLPVGPVIRCPPLFYGDYIIPVEFIQLTDSLENTFEDPRKDTRIIEALRKYNQYREGLACEIISVQKLSSDKVRFEIRLVNNDSENLYLLDPDKMGINLFHYFTNGLILKNAYNTVFTHNITIARPEPWNTWEVDWLSVIKGKETKTISITYNSFKTLVPGQYTAIFVFPGLGRQVEREDLIQENGRIWLGDLHIKKAIIIK